MIRIINYVRFIIVYAYMESELGSHVFIVPT